MKQDTQIDEKVLSFVDHIWEEAQGDLVKLLDAPVDSIKASTLDQAESVLLSLKELMKSESQGIFDIAELEDKFYELIPHKTRDDFNSLSVIHRKIDLCQLIRDVISVSEATNWLKNSSAKAKYKTLGCHIKFLPCNGSEWRRAAEQFVNSDVEDQKIVVHNVYEINRPSEDDAFAADVDNKRFLFHSSQAKNFVGILSRGLLMPKVIVDDFGGTRTDPGMLGSGIYFASSARYVHFCCFKNYFTIK